VGDRGLEPVQLCLAGGQVELPPVELGGAGDRFPRELVLVRQLALEALGVVTLTLLLEHELGLALADGLVAGGDARRLFPQVVLAGCELALALAQLLVLGAPLVLALLERALAALNPDGRGLLPRRQLAFLPG